MEFAMLILFILIMLILGFIATLLAIDFLAGGEEDV